MKIKNSDVCKALDTVTGQSNLHRSYYYEYLKLSGCKLPSWVASLLDKVSGPQHACGWMNKFSFSLDSQSLQTGPLASGGGLLHCHIHFSEAFIWPGPLDNFPVPWSPVCCTPCAPAPRDIWMFSDWLTPCSGDRVSLFCHLRGPNPGMNTFVNS